ncbi:hypothetical protein NHX12_020941 [Muraenolepis orangiensis]|uniref:Uncharacterized protein n=1 Tax=Muraenolepis orangiensis TaxID=630683 RepID=A0A9Q0EVV2_9TELE|nr:hypothetical protein NHX12_020941 [Muraenolepis orangiensis]
MSSCPSYLGYYSFCRLPESAGSGLDPVPLSQTPTGPRLPGTTLEEVTWFSLFSLSNRLLSSDTAGRAGALRLYIGARTASRRPSRLKPSSISSKDRYECFGESRSHHSHKDGFPGSQYHMEGGWGGGWVQWERA